MYFHITASLLKKEIPGLTHGPDVEPGRHPAPLFLPLQRPVSVAADPLAGVRE